MPRPPPNDSAFEQAARRIRREFHDALPVNPTKGMRVRGYRCLRLFSRKLPADAATVLLIGITGQVLPFPRAVLDALQQIDRQGFAILTDSAASARLGCDTVVAIVVQRVHGLWMWH